MGQPSCSFFFSLCESSSSLLNPHSARRLCKPPPHPSLPFRSPHPRRRRIVLCLVHSRFRSLERRFPTERPSMNPPASTTAISRCPLPNHIPPSPPILSTSPGPDANEALYLRARVVPRLDHSSNATVFCSCDAKFGSGTSRTLRPGLSTSVVFDQAPLGTYPSMARGVQVCAE